MLYYGLLFASYYVVIPQMNNYNLIASRACKNRIARLISRSGGRLIMTKLLFSRKKSIMFLNLLGTLLTQVIFFQIYEHVWCPLLSCRRFFPDRRHGESTDTGRLQYIFFKLLHQTIKYYTSAELFYALTRAHEHKVTSSSPSGRRETFGDKKNKKIKICYPCRRNHRDMNARSKLSRTEEIK